jgi:hypothetical protein
MAGSIYQELHGPGGCCPVAALIVGLNFPSDCCRAYDSSEIIFSLLLVYEVQALPAMKRVLEVKSTVLPILSGRSPNALSSGYAPAGWVSRALAGD